MARIAIHSPDGKRKYICRVWQDNGFTNYAATYHLVNDTSAWCRMNLEYGSYSEENIYTSEGGIDGVTFDFGSDEDVMAFKLSWSE